VERWFRVTYNQRADFFGDAWFAGAAGVPAGAPAARPAMAKPPVQAPASAPGLVFVWENERAKNAVLDGTGKVKRVWSAKYDGLSRPNRWYGADVRQGGLLPSDQAAGVVAESIREKKQFSLAVDAVCRAVPEGVGTIAFLGHAADGRVTFAMEQTGAKIALRMLAKTGEPITVSLGEVQTGTPFQVTAAYDGSVLHGYLNGQEAAAVKVETDLAAWQPDTLVFGRNGSGGDYWDGSVENLRIWDRAVTAEETTAAYQSFTVSWANRKPGQTVVVEAELMEVSEPADPETIAPYTRSLGENLYKVKKVESGTLDAEKIVVLQWVILGGKQLDTAEREPGKVYRLTLEPESARSELSGEHRSTDLFELDAPVFYDVES
jgi:hypothetical protein